MGTNMTQEMETCLRKVAEINNISWENAKFFFDMGLYEGKISAITRGLK